ncbi:hypothetical protein PIECOFPK_00464 [Mycovorax composti]|jgi:Ion transport protein.|uniref:Ion transport domain-containing protein n=2 Tax=Chitinophagaceae TaxID=563835 RepID=A0ABZ2EH65_9BACT
MSLFHIIPDRHDVVQDHNAPKDKNSFRHKLYVVIFQNNTRAGRLFNVGLFLFIFASIILLILESVESISIAYDKVFDIIDYVFLIVFSIEYLLRLYCVRDAKKYALSFYGIIDFLAIVPSYMEFFLPNWHMLMAFRCFRLLRIFRIFRMVRLLDESRYMMLALLRNFNKILVFLFFIVLLTLFLGVLLYVIESPYNPGFSSIPQSVYWAIVTITTVGYGDVAPMTIGGKMIASFIMILGYAIIAVPTGMLSAAVVTKYRDMDNASRTCPHCHNKNNASDALYCKICGTPLSDNMKQK